MNALVYETCRAVEAETGAKVECNIIASYPGVVNHDAETALAERAAQALLGAERVHRIETPTMKTEDFGYFLEEKPGTYYHVGAGCAVPLHNAAFLPTADCVVTTAAVNAAVLHSYLSSVTTG